MSMATMEGENKKKIVEIHYLMLEKLSRIIAKDIEHVWNSFKNALRGNSLILGDVHLKKCDNIFKVCKELMDSGKISYGKYDKLRKCFEKEWVNNVEAVEIIDDTTKSIQDIQAAEENSIEVDAVPDCGKDSKMESQRESKSACGGAGGYSGTTSDGDGDGKSRQEIHIKNSKYVQIGNNNMVINRTVQPDGQDDDTD